MIRMKRTGFVCILFVAGTMISAQGGVRTAAKAIDYETAVKHELKPHRSLFPVEGVRGGSKRLGLRLTVSAEGAVVDARASGYDDAVALWPKVKPEVMGWKFMPFEVNGRAATVQVDEEVELRTPEVLPTKHVTSPEVGPESKVKITLSRSGCYGWCPAYTVSITTEDIAYFGERYVGVTGAKSEPVDAAKARELAKKFVAADFYSMDEEYVANVTDLPTYTLSIDIDGHEKKVMDYAGTWVGMPQAIKELEAAVDEFARTERWVKGGKGTR